MWQAQEFVRRIGSVLRTQTDEVPREPLPERWVDLIRYLNEKECKKLEAEPDTPRRRTDN
jgi:hypothetical protein